MTSEVHDEMHINLSHTHTVQLHAQADSGGWRVKGLSSTSFPVYWHPPSFEGLNPVLLILM